MADFDRQEWLKNLKVGDSVRVERGAASGGDIVYTVEKRTGARITARGSFTDGCSGSVHMRCDSFRLSDGRIIGSRRWRVFINPLAQA